MALSRAEFNDLVEQHAPALYRMAYRMIGDRHEAEDVVQEVFLSAMKNLCRLRDEECLGGWLIRIAINKCRSHWRKLEVRRRLLKPVDYQPHVGQQKNSYDKNQNDCFTNIGVIQSWSLSWSVATWQ